MITLHTLAAKRQVDFAVPSVVTVYAALHTLSYFFLVATSETKSVKLYRTVI